MATGKNRYTVLDIVAPTAAAAAARQCKISDRYRCVTRNRLGKRPVYTVLNLAENESGNLIHSINNAKRNRSMDKRVEMYIMVHFPDPKLTEGSIYL